MIHESDVCVQSSFGHTIRNWLLAQEPQSDALAVLFPGSNGTCDIPLLHYARKVALLSACDVLSLEYGYVRTEQSFSRELYSPILKESLQAVEACDLAKYRRIYFISKSFGTLIAGEIAGQVCHLPIKSLYLTPLEDTVPYMSKTNCTVVAGDRDNLFPDVFKLRDMGTVDLRVFPGAGHSLEVKDDYRKSLDILARVTDICHAFLQLD